MLASVIVLAVTGAVSAGGARIVPRRLRNSVVVTALARVGGACYA